ncbi:MAG: VanZ family protein [Prevotella sp.]|nr:VanZ family protein [Prevotella sp.]
MQEIKHFVRKYPFSILCIILIWILSLIPFFPETPLDDVQFIDKWTHLVMYGGTCSVIWWEYLRQHTSIDKQKLFLLAWLTPILMSGVIELLQEYCTTTRGGEWFDFAANATGVTLAVIVGLVLCYIKSLNKNTRHNSLL